MPVARLDRSTSRLSRRADSKFGAGGGVVKKSPTFVAGRPGVAAVPGVGSVLGVLGVRFLLPTSRCEHDDPTLART
jgi:hypothetical protein